MVHVRVISHADLQALQDRSDELLVLELVSLESVRIASDSYALLRILIEPNSRKLPQVGKPDRRYWSCPQIDLLSVVAGVALELHKIKHDQYPLLVVQEAKLEGGFLVALLLLKNSAVSLLRLAKDAKELVERCVESIDDWDDHDDDVLVGRELIDEEDDVLLGIAGKVEEVGKMAKDIANLVLKGTHNIAWLQLRLPKVLKVVDGLLSNPVIFPDYRRFVASSSLLC